MKLRALATRATSGAQRPPVAPRTAGPDSAPSPPQRSFRLPTGLLDPDDCIPIAGVQFRQRAQVKGQVRSIRIRPWADVPTLELVLADATGGITVAFLGRRHVAGIRPGSLLTVEGMVGSNRNRLTVLNPHYDLRPFPFVSSTVKPPRSSSR